ncbi:hypothetical protein AVANS_0559 [Campylobacter sp. RM5004]|uniref:DUF3137 domain-containing protein n=1 Tax=Campylobacter sp. RM5004 TaxID=1660078 RepID=UPI001EFC0AD1|nr:DUF3137 domain-containing protein [Campylobacter sp. RM5004]ULO01194.1 hypothetical protein AVANS_0559 [Campylobacter sp. RM5004]
MIKIISLFFIALIGYEFYKFLNDFNEISILIYLFIAWFLVILFVLGFNFYVYVIPFFYKNFKIIHNKDLYKNSLIKPLKAKIFYSYQNNDIDILGLCFYEFKDLEPFYNFSYLDVLFFGVYVRVNRKIKHNFRIFASKRLMSLYQDEWVFFEKSFASDNIEFNKKFSVYSNDLINDFKFFTPKKLANIVKAASNINKKFSIIYSKDYFEIYIHNFFFTSNIKKEYVSLLKIIQEFSE